jgi:ABC-2 family transporter protein
MTALPATLLVRQFVADYARHPVNLLVIVLVPLVFVVVAAGSLADAAKLLGGASGAIQVQTVTAGWTAGFVAAIAMYFQVAAARDVDRRLVISGLPTARLVGARLATGLVVALLASVAALLALQARTGIDQPGRVIAGTLMFAVIYLAIGAAAGALVRNSVNGTVLILFVWILDVFFGPTMSPDKPATRLLPTHFVSLWMVDLPSGHGGRPGDLGWALAWTLVAVALAWTVIVATSRVAHRPCWHARPGSARDQLTAAVRMGWRDWRRNRVLWALLVIVPAVFILLADAITPDGTTRLALLEHGRRVTATFNPADIHAGTMTPIAIASLAALAGLFVAVDARSGDQRLALAGLRTGVVLAARLAVIGLAGALATAVSLAAAATVFDARQWGVYAAANLLIAVTYGLLGVLLGSVFGRVGGVFVAFLVPFLDLGIAQSPMLRADPAAWAVFLPGYGGMRILLDGGLTATFDQTRPLLVAALWLVGLTAATTVLFRHAMRTQRRSGWKG